MVTIYKIGSRGEVVKQIQQALVRAGFSIGIADGIYGMVTAEAVRAYQKKNGLTADGIVGPATLSRLLSWPDIRQGYIHTHITRCANRQVKYIAIHYTAGSTSKSGKAMEARNIFLSRNASADFVVDDEQIVQINPDIKNYFCWAVGDKKNATSRGGRLYGIATNKNTVSIEICSNLRAGTTAAIPNHDGWYFTDKAVNNALRLVRYLMQQYNIPKSNVVRHYDVSGKLCPGIIGWNDANIYTTAGKPTSLQNSSQKWTEFLNKI